jgi:transcriptional regulator with XRE-family HTH domain
MNIIGEIIFNRRKAQNQTQDEYGRQFDVSGPAVFKFEKGYVKPSLDLWLKMAKDAGVPLKRAVLVWAKAKLPKEYQVYIELQSGFETSEPTAGRKAPKHTSFAKLKSRDEIRQAAKSDKEFPKGLRELLEDDELWSLYRPTGEEIDRLREIFSPLGVGSVAAYRDALRVLREFSQP